MDRLPRDFYAQDSLLVAPALLGQRLVRVLNGERLAGRIVETEAYRGEADAASHAARGRTARTAVMYGPPGHAYVYFTYGMHFCLNAVTGLEGVASAVLLRALEPLEGIATLRTHRGGREGRELSGGPARLCQALAIGRSFNGADLVAGAELFIEADAPVAAERIATGPRIGVRGDAAALAAPWRFILRDSPYVSRG